LMGPLPAGTIDMEPIMSPETEQLAKEVAEMTGESADEVIRKALEERKQALAPPAGPESEGAKGTVEDWIRFLEEEVWSKIDPELLGKPVPPEVMAEVLGWSPEDGDFSKTDLELV
jgi:hypothetical protein